jgi:predicted TIM-barrel fold metal-dependent hydrolase
MTAAAPFIIDTDTHLTEPADLWTSRLPKSWGEDVMHVAWDESRQEEVWRVGSKILRAAWSSCQYERNTYPVAPATAADAHPATVVQSERVKVMDEIGIKTAVLYPNVGGLNARHFLAMENEQIALAHVRAYNDYQLDFANTAPGRFVPMLVVPFWDVAESVAEIERMTGKGFGGIVMTGAPQYHEQPFLADPHWDRLWSATLAAGFSVSFHVGNGGASALKGNAMDPDRLTHDLPGTVLTRSATFPFLENGKQIADLVLSGVLNRYPDLMFASVESGVGWIPFVLECMDYHYKRSTKGIGNLPWGDLLPSDLFRRQIYANFWFERLEPWHIEAVGVDHILFETDFPHPTSLGLAETQEAITDGMAGFSQEVKEKILWKNAAKLYNLDEVASDEASKTHPLMSTAQ